MKKLIILLLILASCNTSKKGSKDIWIISAPADSQFTKIKTGHLVGEKFKTFQQFEILH